MIGSLLDRVHGNTVVFANLPGQRRIPFLGPRRLAQLRDARLRSIVQHAAEAVPYYRELFRSGRVTVRQIQCAEDLDRLPLLNRDWVRDNVDRFVSAEGRRRGVPFRTSGSTGRRLTLYHDRHSLLANIAFGERERHVLSELLGA